MCEQSGENKSVPKQNILEKRAFIIGGCIIAAIAVFAVGLAISTAIAVNGFVEYKSIAAGGGITATGSASKVFKSDMANWNSSFSVHGVTTEDAYETIKTQTEIIKAYLFDVGIKENEITFLSVDIYPQTRYEYNDEGRIIAEYPDGYILTQSLFVSTEENVDKIEIVSQKASELISSGVNLNSYPPQYFYTRLDELKLEMIEEATQNAKSRIDIIATNSNSRVGKLMNANLGVFQITGYPSSQEFTAGGYFDTSSMWKTASVTVRLFYAVD